MYPIFQFNDLDYLNRRCRSLQGLMEYATEYPEPHGPLGLDSVLAPETFFVKSYMHYPRAAILTGDRIARSIMS